VFFSFTFGGEALSLAAAKATLTKLKEQPVVQTIAERGRAIMQGTQAVIEGHKLGDIFAVSGHPSWSFLGLRDARGATAFEVKTLLMQELHQRGLLSVGSHNVNFAHSTDDVRALLKAYEEVLPMIGQHLDKGTLRAALRCEPLVPLFKVR
jgi:glutamate-1-semialdehyde 2,1-aminomutase